MNLRDALRQLNIRWWEHGQTSLVSAGWIGLICGWCDGGKGKPGLGVHVRTFRTSCWRCGKHSLVEALAKSSGKPFAHVKALLGGLAPPERPEERPRGHLQLPPDVGPLGAAHRKYLRKRRFDPDELERLWGIQGIGDLGGVLAWRIFIPVRNPLGRTVSWSTRAIGSVADGMRYRGAKAEQSEVPRGEILYGAEHARHAVIVVEGPTKCWRGGVGFVATAGVGFSPAQVSLISQYPVRAILFDGEREAQRRARQLAEMLAPFPGETYVVQPSVDDLDDAPDEEIRELRERFLE